MQQQTMWTKYTNNNEVAIEFSRKRANEHSTLFYYKKTKQIRRRVVVIQSVLCEDMLRVKRAVLVWWSPLYRLNEQVVLVVRV